MSIMRYVEISLAVVYVVASVFSLIVSWLRAKRANNIAEQEKIKATIKTAAEQFIKDAEQFKNYAGEEKLQYVVTRLKGINQSVYSDDELVALINELVKLTNDVNTAETKKGVMI